MFDPLCNSLRKRFCPAHALLLFSIAAFAQSDFNQAHLVPFRNQLVASAPAARISRNVDLVLVNVTVLDRNHRAVSGLTARDFQVIDNRQPQSIKYFSRTEQPVSLLIVLDASASMVPHFELARQAATQLVHSANLFDDVSVIAFNDSPHVLKSRADDLDDLEDRLRTVQPEGKTALWDGIFMASEKLRRARHQRMAMVVITDGGDNRSRYTESELKARLAEEDIQLYVLGMHDPFTRRPEERVGPLVLDQLTKATGGTLLWVPGQSELNSAVTRISDELRSQYVVGYYLPTSASQSGHHELKVTLNDPDKQKQLKVQARREYFQR